MVEKKKKEKIQCKFPPNDSVFDDLVIFDRLWIILWTLLRAKYSPSLITHTKSTPQWYIPFTNAPLFTFLMRYLFLIFLDTVKFHIVSATIYIYIQIQYITIHLKPCKFRKNSELKLKGFPILYNRPVSYQIYRKALMTVTSIQKRKTESSYEYSKWREGEEEAWWRVARSFLWHRFYTRMCA